LGFVRVELLAAEAAGDDDLVVVDGRRRDGRAALELDLEAGLGLGRLRRLDRRDRALVELGRWLLNLVGVHRLDFVGDDLGFLGGRRGCGAGAAGREEDGECAHARSNVRRAEKICVPQGLPRARVARGTLRRRARYRLPSVVLRSAPMWSALADKV